MSAHPLTKEAFELAAAALAVACNGGGWLTHYTDAQRELWRLRVRAALPS
jgi:hypothetical protein